MKLSIITVVYNGESTIERTIRSVIEQSNAELEYIIVDGGSADRTMEIVEKYKENISQVISEADDGIYDAMNKGIRLATGDIIAFLNCDDWYEKDTLQYVIEMFQNDKIDILCTDARIINEYGTLTRRADLDEKIIIKQLPTSHQAIFASKEWFDYIGEFNTQYSVSADYEWVTRSMAKGCRMRLCHRIVVNFSTGGVSTNYSDLCYEEIKKAAFQYYMGTPLEAALKNYYAYRDYMRTGNDEEWERAGFSANACKIRIPAEKNIYIFGIGKIGKECYKLLEKLGYVVYGFLDNHIKSEQTEYMGKLVHPPGIIQAGTDYIIIASTKYENDMKMQMERLGLCEEQDFNMYTAIRDKVIYG